MGAFYFLNCETIFLFLVHSSTVTITTQAVNGARLNDLDERLTLIQIRTPMNENAPVNIDV